jgi:hypothetical protein
MQFAPKIRRGLRCVGRFLLACAATCIISGCASIRPVEPGVPFELGSDEGILVVHVETNAPVVSLDFNRQPAATDLPEGEHLLLLRVGAGKYRWSGVTLGAARYQVRKYYMVRGMLTSYMRDSTRPVAFELSEGEMGFSVVAGRINYVGMMLLNRTESHRLYARPVDRTASAVAQLEKLYPDEMAGYPIVYSGRAHHVFLDRYLGERSKPSGGEAP